MFGLGGWEIGLLVIFGLLFFGPKKLPQLMRQAGKIMGEVKKASNEFQYSIERELDDDQFRRQHRREKKLAKLRLETEGGAAGDASNGAGTGAMNEAGSAGVNGANGAETPPPAESAADSAPPKPKS